MRARPSAPARCAVRTFGLVVALVAGGACDAQGPVTDAPASGEALEPAQRLADFKSAFGDDLEKLEKDYLRRIIRLR